MSFYRWILDNYLNKTGPISDLAKDINADEDFPKEGSKDVIESYLYYQDACLACMDVFEEAWAIYERENNRTKTGDRG